MRTYTLYGRVTPDGLDVTLPVGIPCGEATVMLVLPDPEKPEETASDYPRGDLRHALALLDRWEREGRTGSGRSKEEVDAELASMRDDWDG
ncbi:MAG: hypothetical protein ACKVVT_11195 [Dehalococcoidia bacterium]